jgi:hypothetical protein
VVLTIRVELANATEVQRSHDADARKHRRAAERHHQDQRLHGSLLGDTLFADDERTRWYKAARKLAANDNVKPYVRVWQQLLLCIVRQPRSPLMPGNDADRFRKQAQECVEQAERSISPLDKETWLRVAAEWMKLAQSVDDRDGKPRK